MKAMYNLFIGDPTMILTKELAFLKAKEEFQNMIELAKQAANNGILTHKAFGGLLLKRRCPPRQQHSANIAAESGDGRKRYYALCKLCGGIRPR